jgi:hypothetical protein
MALAQLLRPLCELGGVCSKGRGLAAGLAKKGGGQGGRLRAADADVLASQQVQKDHLITDAAGPDMLGEPQRRG